VNPEEEFEQRRDQRAAFLCEVYKRVQGDSSKSVPCDQVETVLGFQQDAIEQVRLWLQAERFIEVYPSPIIQVVPPAGRTVGQSQSHSEKLIVLTEKGISLARDICRS
jgi:hypothetical protein